MEVKQSRYRELYKELSLYEKHGIHMTMDGKPASPLQIAAAHMVKEEKSYMRDYVLDEEGHLKELSFYHL